MDLVGSDELHSEEMVRTMWKESMKSVNCSQARITYDNFLLLMKGQTREPEPERSVPSSRRSGLLAVPEGVSVDEADGPPKDAEMPLDKLLEQNVALDTKKGEDDISMHSLPNLGAKDLNESSNSSLGFGSPGRVEDGSSPHDCKGVSETQWEDDEAGADFAVEDESNVEKGKLGRKRSYSLPGENDESSDVAKFGADSRRAVALPEHDRNIGGNLNKSKSALVVNRQLYRAHRQMRLSVLEASRRFEEQQTRRARDTLIAQKEAEAGLMGAGLVMRHGLKVQVSSEAIRKLLDENRAEQQVLVEKANRRGGRGRSSRKKTISDMSAMMTSSMGQDELGAISAQASKTPDNTRNLHHMSVQGALEMPSLTEEMPQAIPLPPRSEKNKQIPVVDTGLRGATVPGEFRKTQDPFSAEGMYGGARITAQDVRQIRSEKRSEG